MKTLIIFEPTTTGYSAYCPDIPGVVATGASKEEAEYEIDSALKFHFEGMEQSKYKIPKERSYSKYLELAI